MPAFLPVVETFHSLQGEGFHYGKSAFFIRLAGCRVECPWCDTKESWNEKNHIQQDVKNLASAAAKAKENGAAFTVITGGEPLHHDLSELTKALSSSTQQPLHLETSGVDPLSGKIDWITLSPKRHLMPRKELLAKCDELKVIIHKLEDINFAESVAKETTPKTILLLQPGWASKEGKKITLNYLKQNPSWRLSLQTHKYMGIL